MAKIKLTKVTVLPITGVTLRGPATVKLTEDQHQPRAHVLGKWRTGGIFELAGDQALTFKRGEEFGIHQPEDRLNRALFGWDDPAPPAAKVRSAPSDGTKTDPVPDTQQGTGEDGDTTAADDDEEAGGE